MKRFAGIALGLLFALLVAAPAALAADPAVESGRVLISVGGDVTVPADDTADVVLVVDGTATIAGQVRTLVVIEGSAILDGAQAQDIWAIRSTVELQPGTVVGGDVRTLDTAVHQVGDAVVQGEVSDIGGSLVAFGAVLAPALVLFWLGFGLATIVAGLLLAGIASRQVRAAEHVISHEALLSIVAGLVGLILLPVAAVLLMVTIVGAPLGLGILLGIWPLLAFVGYLVAGIWIGEWLLGRTTSPRVRERPYLAAVIGLVLLQLIGIVPVLSIVSGIASLFGFGAVLVLTWRTLVSRPGGTQPVAAAPAPVSG
jgi:hypothetical protein